MRLIQGTKKEFLLLGVSALVAVVLFITYSGLESGLGFPLDDAWIHQTFARNLAYRGEWSFIAGQPSGASTGPLWGMVLAILYCLKIPPLWGTYLIGYLLIWSLGIAGMNFGQRLLPESKIWPLILGLVCTLEWHLVWSALSGMETMVLSLLSLVVFCWLLDKKENWWAAGLMIGLSIWIRPDGLTLLGPVVLSLIVRGHRTQKLMWSSVGLLGGLLVVILPYFLFNYVVAGDVWPNTFYAKQAEYAFLNSQPLLIRIKTVSLQLFVGIGVVLVPGLLYEVKESAKAMEWERIGAFLWTAGFVLIYVWRLPVAYQHGRYIMPVMPVFFLLGLAGMARMLNIESTTRWRRVLSRSWSAVAGISLLIFLGLGARSYALDTGVINTEMVQAAKWVRENTPREAVIAAHDIGALGYFGERQITDLAGLISPDVIPFFGDDQSLARYLDDQNVDYLYSFTDWYPGLIDGLTVAYESQGEYSNRFGIEKTAVYYWGHRP